MKKKNKFLIVIIFSLFVASMFVLASCGGTSDKEVKALDSLNSQLDKALNDFNATKTMPVSSNSGGEPDVYYGTWKNTKENMKLIITNEGKTGYYVCTKSLVNGDLFCWDCFSYKDGNLCIDGEKKLTYSDGKIIYRGNEYEKVN